MKYKRKNMFHQKFGYILMVCLWFLSLGPFFVLFWILIWLLTFISIHRIKIYQASYSLLRNSLMFWWELWRLIKLIWPKKMNPSFTDLSQMFSSLLTGVHAALTARAWNQCGPSVSWVLPKKPDIWKHVKLTGDRRCARQSSTSAFPTECLLQRSLPKTFHS